MTLEDCLVRTCVEGPSWRVDTLIGAVVGLHKGMSGRGIYETRSFGENFAHRSENQSTCWKLISNKNKLKSKIKLEDKK